MCSKVFSGLPDHKPGVLLKDCGCIGVCQGTGLLARRKEDLSGTTTADKVSYSNSTESGRKPSVMMH